MLEVDARALSQLRSLFVACRVKGGEDPVACHVSIAVGLTPKPALPEIEPVTVDPGLHGKEGLSFDGPEKCVSLGLVCGVCASSRRSLFVRPRLRPRRLAPCWILT